jgi:DNA gyrase subunit B
MLDALMGMPMLEPESLQSQSAIRAWFAQMEERLNNGADSQGDYAISVEDRPEDGFRATLRAVVHGVEAERSLGSEFFRSAEYRNFVTLSQRLYDPLGSEAVVRRGDKSESVAHFSDALDWLLSEARRGLSVQRYKGLGEMNPDQLWETTMDPEVRRLRQVRIEDAVAADELFTTLMGDQVEPRREFIETNALSVANLDA